MHKICFNIYIHVCLVCFFDVFKIHIQEAKVLSVWFPKEYNHINLGAKHPKLCTYFLQNSVFFLGFVNPYFHTYVHTCIHAHTYIYVYTNLHITHLLIVWFFRWYVYIYKHRLYIYVYIHVCGVFFWCLLFFQETKILSAGFHKEYDHINLAVKHPKLCTYFIQNSV
jgi:hypothetical protein